MLYVLLVRKPILTLREQLNQVYEMSYFLSTFDECPTVLLTEAGV